jgi:hypothetical protein
MYADFLNGNSIHHVKVDAIVNRGQECSLGTRLCEKKGADADLFS